METVKILHNKTGRSQSLGEAPQYPSSRQRGCYIGTITASVQLKKKISGCGSQGA
jgi:hypothetical protein